MSRRRRQPARDRARAWLLNALACGPVTVDAIRFQSHKARISWGTLRRARQGVAAPVRVAGIGARGYWVWQLTKMSTPHAKALTNGGVCPVCGRSGGVPTP